MVKYALLIAASCAALTLASCRTTGAPQDDGASADTAGLDRRCASFASSALPDGVVISSAEHVVASAGGQPAGPPGAVTPALPAHCLVKGTLDPRTGVDGKAYGIGFALALPDDWNGRFLLQGGGGLNGSVAQPLGPVASGDKPALARGFAVVSHDSGHTGAVFDDSFLADQRAALDFAEASVKTVTLAARHMVRGYYGSDIAYSYMTGCSTGGREGMLAMQRYPELFDGIVVGAPAMRTGDSNLAIEWAAVQFNKALPKLADGKPDLSALLPPAQRQSILTGMLEQCDALDGLADGMIENVASCRFDATKLQCKAGENPSGGCFPPAIATAMNAVFEGPKDAAGYPVYAPFPVDTGIVNKEGPVPGYLPTGQAGFFGTPPDRTEIDLDARLNELRSRGWQRLTDTHVWTNLSTFLGHDGKVLFFHGVSDAWFSAFATRDYYQRAAEANGADWANASRLYMVPGMAHCGGGNAYDKFDLLTPLVEWVERGQAPASPIASRRSTGDQRPLCNYPSYAAYTGGDRSKAESYSCRIPD